MQINNSLLTLSSDYQDRNIFFLEIGRTFINDNSFYDGISSESEYNSLINTNRHSDAIDIYFLNPTDGFARASGIPGDALAFGGYYSETSVLSHEIGHCLGLYHTHSGSGCNDYANCKENIDGSNCSTCGDLVCDTPADPCLSGKVDNNCNYTGGGGYSPDTDNIMSYAPPTCLDDLTNGQMSRLHNIITNSPTLQALSYILKISGTNTVCTSNSTFTLQNRPPNSSVSWTKSSNLSYVSGQGTDNYRVKANSSSTSGQGWVQANINEATFEKSVWVGKPSNFTITGSQELMPREPGMAFLHYSDDLWANGVSNVSWSYTGPLDYINGDIKKARYRAGNSSGLGFIYALATNTCGQKENRLFYEVSGWHKAYPNPVKDILTIEIDKSEMPKRLISKKIEILLYDKMMSLKKKSSFSGTLTTINVSNLKPDIYILQIKIDDEIFEEKIIVSEK